MLVSGSVSFAPLLAVALPTRTVGVLTAFAMGSIYGHAALERMRSPRTSRFVAGFEAILLRVGPLLLVLAPAYVVGLLAGAARLELRRAVPAIMVGQLVAVTVAYFLGSLIAPWTAQLIDYLREHLLVIGVACAGLVLGFAAWRRLRRDPPGPS